MSEKRFEEIIEKSTAIETIHPQAQGFIERVTPKALPNDVYLWNCPCGNKHFRHAGYVQDIIPFMRQGGEKRVSLDNKQVMVCTKCKNSYIWVNEQMYNITEHIDLAAWEKLEEKAYKTTGPGGQC